MQPANITEKDRNEASFFGLQDPLAGSSTFSSPEVEGMTKVGDVKVLPSGTKVQNYITPQGSSLGLFFRKDKKDQIVNVGDFVLFIPPNTQSRVVGRVVKLKDGKGQAAYLSQYNGQPTGSEPSVIASPTKMVVRIDGFNANECEVVLLNNGDDPRVTYCKASLAAS